MKKNIQKRMLAMFAVLVLSLGVFTGCGSSNTTEGKNTGETNVEETDAGEVVIHVANFPFAIWNDQFIIAYQNGIFDEVFADDNVTVEVIDFENGPAANEAFIAGDIDIVNGIGDQPIVIGIGNQIDTTIISGAAKQGGNIGIIAPKEAGITSAKDLKGKRVGVYVGTYVHKSLIGILNDAGISEDEVEIVNITTTSDADAAFGSGDIDAYLSMNASHIHKNVDEGDFVKVADCSAHAAYSYNVAANSFVEAHPDLMEKFIDALYQAEQWIKDNEEEAYQVISDFSGMEVEEVKYTNQDADRTIVWDDGYRTNLTETYEFLKEHDMITTDLTDEDIEQHINISFLEKVTGK